MISDVSDTLLFSTLIPFMAMFRVGAVSVKFQKISIFHLWKGLI